MIENNSMDVFEVDYVSLSFVEVTMTCYYRLMCLFHELSDLLCRKMEIRCKDTKVLGL